MSAGNQITRGGASLPRHSNQQRKVRDRIRGAQCGEREDEVERSECIVCQELLTATGDRPQQLLRSRDMIFRTQGRLAGSSSNLGLEAVSPSGKNYESAPGFLCCHPNARPLAVLLKIIVAAAPTTCDGASCKHFLLTPGPPSPGPDLSGLWNARENRRFRLPVLQPSRHHLCQHHSLTLDPLSVAFSASFTCRHPNGINCLGKHRPRCRIYSMVAFKPGTAFESFAEIHKNLFG